MKKNILFGFILALGVVYVPFIATAQVGTSDIDWSTGYVSPSGQLTPNAPAQTTVYAPVTYSSPASTGIAGGTGNVIKLISFLQDALNIAVRLILAAAVVFFLWGVFQFVRAAGNEEAQTVGKNHIIYGIIGIAVMVSLWGLVNFLTGSANLDITTEGISVPELLEMPN